MDGMDCFAISVSYSCKMFMKLTTGINVFKPFLASLMQLQ